MKNEVTFQIEHKQLSKLISDKQFEEADEVCTKMLTNYNKLDYELLLKRARIRQCLMKYEEAALDARLALHVLPQRIDAYYVLSDFLVALGNYGEALKILEILHSHDPNDALIRGQYEQIRDKEKKKTQRSQTKIDARIQRQNDLRQQGQTQYLKMKQFLDESKLNEKNLTEENEKELNPKLTRDDYVLLSDELVEDSDEDTSVSQVQAWSHSLNEKPGNAQHLETPTV